MHKKRSKFYKLIFSAIFLVLLVGFFMFEFLILKNKNSDQETSSMSTSDEKTTINNSITEQTPSNVESNSNFDNKDSATTGTTTTRQPVPTDINEEYKYYDTGLSQLRAGDYSGAIVNFSKAISIYKSEPLFYSNKAEAHIQLGQKDEALATINEGLNYNPGSQVLLDKLDIINELVK